MRRASEFLQSLLIGAVLLLGGACDRTPAATQRHAPLPAAEQDSAVQEVTAQAVGQAIVAVQRAALVDTAQLLQDRPPPAQALALFEAKEQQWIDQLLPLGAQEQRFDAMQRRSVRLQVSLFHQQLQRDPELIKLFKAYTQAVNHYIDVDPELHRRLARVNIITQYAFHDLLRKQAPEEALRLGL